MTKFPGKTGETLHTPIMVEEVLQYMRISKLGTYLDCTVGYGGHAHFIIKQLSKNGKLIGIDKDERLSNSVKKRYQPITTSIYFITPTIIFQISYHPRKLKRLMVCY